MAINRPSCPEYSNCGKSVTKRNSKAPGFLSSSISARYSLSPPSTRRTIFSSSAQNRIKSPLCAPDFLAMAFISSRFKYLVRTDWISPSSFRAIHAMPWAPRLWAFAVSSWIALRLRTAPPGTHSARTTPPASITLRNTPKLHCAAISLSSMMGRPKRRSGLSVPY